MLQAPLLPKRNKTRNVVEKDNLNTWGNVVTIVAVGEAPSKYFLREVDILDSLHPCGSFTYFKL